MVDILSRHPQLEPILKRTSAVHIQLLLVFGFLLLTHPGILLAQFNDFSENATSPDSQQLTLHRTDLNVPIPPLELEEVLAQSSVLATLPKGQRLSFFDAYFTAVTQATVLLQANPSRLMAAVLAGEIQVQDEMAEAGEALAWPIGEESIQVVVFDATSVLATHHALLSPYTRAHLEEVAQSQERLKFWGLLEHTNIMSPHPFNDNSSASAQRYLGNPVVLQLTRQYPEVEQLRQGVAETFVDALRSKDVQTLEWLISPLIFVDDAEELYASEWTLARQDFAFLLMLDHGETEFIELPVKASADPLSWIVTTATGQYRLWLEPFDGMIFVTAFEPIQQNLDESRK